MKTLILIFTAITISVSVQAQITWTVRNTGIPHYILGIAPLNDTTVIASSQDQGYIIKSTNTGDNWSTITNYSGIWLEWITFPDQNTGYTVGSGGRIYKSTNAGTNWTQQAIGLYGNQFYEAQFLNKDTGWIVGGGIILKTSNGGTNWITQFTGSQTHRALYFINNDTGWVVGYSGTIRKTTNSGINWVSQTLGSSDISSVNFTSALTGYICDFSHQIFKTTNGGTNWILNYAQSQPLENINFTDQNTGWCVGGGGKILKTTNAGLNWSVIDGHTSAYLVTVRFMNYNTGWITGDGIVLNTTNGSGVNSPAGMPTGLTALAVSDTKINLNWTDTNSTETGFKIQRSSSAAGPWVLKDSVSANTYSYSDINLTNSTVYYYRVYAYNTGGKSPNSNIASDTTFTNSNITFAPDGLLNNLSKLNMNDTVRIYLRNIFSPYLIVDSVKTILDSVNLTAHFSFQNAVSGTYYIVVKHRNSLETWSREGGEIYTSGALFNYDFTTAASKAFGSNQKQKGVKFCIHSGDTDQDGTIDAADISAVENDAENSITGYVNTDLDGDYFVDATDLSIVENNIGVNVVSP